MNSATECWWGVSQGIFGGWIYRRRVILTTLLEIFLSITILGPFLFQKGDAAALEYATETFDGAISNLTFHEVKFVADKRTVERETLRVVKVYPITREKHAETRAELARRKAANQ